MVLMAKDKPSKGLKTLKNTYWILKPEELYEAELFSQQY